MKNNIYGSGGGGGGGSQQSTSSGTEYPDTLKAKSYVKVVDMLGEGEFEEVLVGGLTGLYLNEIPVQNSDGSYNYTGITVETRNGALNQTRMNIASTTENSESVGVEMRYNLPVEKTITAPEADVVRVSVRVPSLNNTNKSTGDVTGTTVEYKIEWKDSLSPTWTTVNDGTGVSSNNVVASDIGSVSFTGYVEYSYLINITPINWTNSESTVYGSTAYSVETNTNGAGWQVVKTGTSSGVETLNGILQKQSSDSVQLRVVFIDNTTPPYDNGGVLNSSVASINVNGVVSSYTGIQTISGKSSSEYEKQVSFRISGTAPWIVRCTRLTADSTTSYLQNKTYFSSVTTVLEEKLRYPGSVLVGLQVDAEQFSSVPNRGFLCKCLKVKVPNNYNPITREYTGIWDGTFKVAWTDNPAWCFYDLITNTRYGLGERIPASSVDKWELYTVAKYCDGLVPGEDGVFEPRFTCNVVIQTKEEAYQMVSDFASVFRGMNYWGMGAVVAVQDSPRDPSYAFNNTNVVDGVFAYQSSTLISRFNAVSVSWNNPRNFYKKEVEYVEDSNLITSLGYVNETSVVAFGCSSRAMARRVGKWLIYTNNYQTDIVTFSTGMEGVIPKPGDVVKVSDTLRSDDRRGGRVKSATLSSVVIDAPMTFTNGVAYSFTALSVDGDIIESTFSHNGETDTITLTTPLSAAVAKDSIFIISDSNIEPQLFKVISIADKGKQIFEINAVSHDPRKYVYVESGEDLQPRVTTFSDRNPVDGIDYLEYLYADGVSVKSRCDISWKIPKYAKSYIVSIRKPDGVVINTTTTVSEYFLLDTLPGVYDITITAVNIFNRQAAAFTTQITLYGKVAAPQDIINFQVTAVSNKAYLSWDTHPDLDVTVGGYVQILHSPKSVGATWTDGVAIDKVAGSTSSVLVPLLGGTYMVKAIDSSGTFSENAAYATSDYALVQNKNVVETITESPLFAGVKTNMVVDSGQLTLQSSLDIDDALEIDTYSLFDYLGNGVETNGEYLFSNIIDLGASFSVNISSSISAYSTEVYSFIDSRLDDIDNWPFFDSLVPNTATVKLFVATTNDDPLATPIWADWSEFKIATYSARAFKFKLVVETVSEAYSLFVDDLSVSVDVEDRTVGENDIVCTNTGLNIVFAPPFMAIPAISVAINDMEQGDYYEITSKTANGFSLIVKNTSGTPVNRVIDYIAKGYGYKSV